MKIEQKILIIVFWIILLCLPVFAQEPEIVIQKGHSDKINGLAFSSDGKILASASDDKTIILWDVKTWKQYLEIKGHNGQIKSVKFSHDNKYLASLDSENVLKIWELETGKEINSIKNVLSLSEITFSSNLKNIVSNETDKLRIWNIISSKEIFSISSKYDTNDFHGSKFIEVSGNGKYFVFLENFTVKDELNNDIDNFRINLYDLNNPQNHKKFEYKNYASNPVFSNDGKLLAVSSFHDIKIINPENGKVLKSFDNFSSNLSLRKNPSDKFAVFSNDNKMLAFAIFNQGVGIIDLNTGKLLKTDSHFMNPGLKFSNDNKKLILFENLEDSNGSSFTIFDIKAEKNIYNGREHYELIQKPLLIHPRENIFAGCLNNQIKIFYINSGNKILTLNGSKNSSSLLSFSKDGKILVSGSSTMESAMDLKLWDLSSLNEIKSLHLFSKEWETLLDNNSINESERNIKSKNNKFNAKILPDNYYEGKIFSVEDKKEIKSYRISNLSDVKNFIPKFTKLISPQNKYYINEFSYFDDDKGFEAYLGIFEFATNKEVYYKNTDQHFAVYTFSPNESLLGIITSNKLKVIDLKEKKEVFTLENSFNSLSSPCFSNNNRFLAVSSKKNGKDTIIILDALTGKEVKHFETPNFVPRQLGFSNDGKILCALFPFSLIIWDFDSGKELHKFKTDNSLIFSTLGLDGNIIACLATKNANENILIAWDIKTGTEILNFSDKISSNSTFVFNRNGKEVILFENMQDSFRIRNIDIVSGKELSKNSLNGYNYFSAGDPIVLYSIKEKKLDKLVLTNKSDNAQQNLEGHNDKISFIKFSNDSKLLASGGYDKTIKIWDTSSGFNLKTLKVNADIIKALDFSPDDKLIAGIATDKKIRIWNISAGREIISFQRCSEKVTSLIFGKNGKTLINACNDGSINISDVISGKLLHSFKSESNSVISLALNKNNILASQGTDSQIYLWNLNENKQIARFISTDKSDIKLSESKEISREYLKEYKTSNKKITFAGRDRGNTFLISTQFDYLLMTPDNHYCGSKGGLKSLAFKVNNKVFPFEQFDLKFNRPDIVAKRMGIVSPQIIKAYNKAYKKRLKRMGFTEAMLNSEFHLPEVKILTKNIPVVTDNKYFGIEIQAFDSKFLLDRINVYVNNVPVFGIKGIDLKKNKISKIAKTVNLELSNGKNRVQISVLNSKGVESLKETFDINYSGESVKSDLYLVSIGISKYKDKNYNLDYASKDAIDIADFFENKRNKFEKIHILKITDKDAIKENILKVKAFFQNSKVDDQVILFVAGHGLLDKNFDYYFATSDIDFYNPSKRGLMYDDFENILDGIPSRNKLLLIDTCHSGELDKDEIKISNNAFIKDNVKVKRSFRGIKIINKLDIKINDLISGLFTNLSLNSGISVISSASGMEYAFESDKWKNGVFTYSVLEGLSSKNSDFDKDGKTVISELADYVTEKVSSLTEGRQTPTLRNENQEADFVIY